MRMFSWADPPPLPAELPEPPVDPNDSEVERMRAWRVSRYDRLGLPYPLALELAIAGADWHKVKDAVDRGASPELVERIFL